MKKGFYTALGTPFDNNGKFIEESFRKQVCDQVKAGASGLLVMGSMGIEPCIQNSEYVKVAKAGVAAAKDACPVLVGVMDNSIYRVNDRIESLKGLNIDGIVATTPFYFSCTQEEVKNYFKKVSENSPFPLYIYDLPGVTKTRINVDTLKYLASLENIKGIKTGDLVSARILMRSADRRNDFSVVYSGLDLFDVAYKYGITMNLDGMFSCTAPLASEMYSALEKGDFETSAECLDKIIMLRDALVATGVFNGYTHAMNLLGYEGIYAPDYSFAYSEESYEKIKGCMKECSII